MTAVTVLWFVLAVFGVAAVVGTAVLLAMPTVIEASGRLRIQRETQEASWRIHQRATAAFGQLLDVAREAEAREEEQ